MIRSESGPATAEVPPSRSALLGPAGDCHLVGETAPGEPFEDEAALRGVVAIDISHEVIARFSGTLNLNELPERQPEIVFDHGPRYQTGDSSGGVGPACAGR